MIRNHTIAGVFLCLSLFFSCGEKEVPQPPLQTTLLSSGNLLTLNDIFPELESSSSIQFSDPMGYYLSLGEKEWSRSMSVEPVSIPAQSCGFDLDAFPYEDDDHYPAWVVEKNEEIVLEDIPDNLQWGQCPSVFYLTVSLGDDVPYRKVITDILVTFPSSFSAQPRDASYSIPGVEVTAEGAVVPFQLDAIGFSNFIVEKDGRRCCSIPIKVFTQVTASPEDALVSGAENARKIALRYRFDFDRTDFTYCKLDFPDLSFPADELVWDPVRLPSFLCGEGSDLALTHFRIFFDFRNDIPMVPRVNCTLSVNDRKMDFSAGTYFLSAYQASQYHDGYNNLDVPALGTLVKSPFPGGTVQPSLLLQPDTETSVFVVPGQEYSMSAKVNLQLPLAFDGQIDVGSFSTEPLRMEGVSLGGGAHFVHRIDQTLGSNLPLDCMVTPVFTLEGGEPVRLEAFVMDKDHRQAEVSHEFVPESDKWTATLHYIVTPLRGWNEPIRQNCRMDVMKSIFSANLRAAGQ